MDVEVTTAEIPTEEDLMSRKVQTGDTYSDSVVPVRAKTKWMKMYVSLWSNENSNC